MQERKIEMASEAPIVMEQQLPEELERYRGYIDDCRERIIASLATAPAGATLRDYLSRGKMLRPLLVFAACCAVGGDPATVVAAAHAIELLHTASLFHDDIIDQARERRGIQSLHLRSGLGLALVLADYLLLRAFEVIAEISRSDMVADVLEASRTLSRYAQQCCRGQADELLVHDECPSEQAYLAIAQAKTASQFAAAAAVGAILGSGTELEVDNLSTYGLMLGTAFQIRDDMIDLAPDAETPTNRVGRFYGGTFATLPLIYLETYGDPSTRNEYRRMRLTKCDKRALIGLLERAHVIERVVESQERWIQGSLAVLDGLRPSCHVDALRVLANYAVARET
jgi:geranylgeranyl diphosphate synthase type I